MREGGKVRGREGERRKREGERGRAVVSVRGMKNKREGR